MLHLTPDGTAHVFWTPLSQTQITADRASASYVVTQYRVTFGSASLDVPYGQTHVDVPAASGDHAEVRSISAVGVGAAKSSNTWDPQSPWTFAGSLGDPQAALPGVPVGNHIFLLGGLWTDGRPGPSEVLDVQRDGTLSAPMPTSTQLGPQVTAAVAPVDPGHAVAFVSVGFDLTAVQMSADGILSASTKVGKLMPTDRFEARSQIIGGRLYVFGGISAPDRLSGHAPTASVLSCTVSIDPPDCSAWTDDTPLPRPSIGFATASIDSHLYVIGGTRGADLSASSDVFVTTIADGALSPWRHVSAQLPSGLVGARAIAWGGALIVLGGGGDWNGGAPTDQILIGRPDSSGEIAEWTPVLDHMRLVGPRLDPIVAVVNTTLYVLGGRLETPLADVQSIQLDTLIAASR